MWSTIHDGLKVFGLVSSVPMLKEHLKNPKQLVWGGCLGLFASPVSAFVSYQATKALGLVDADVNVGADVNNALLNKNNKVSYALSVASLSIEIPISEEDIFRDFLQKKIFVKKYKEITRKITGEEKDPYSLVGKATRILATSALFSLWHLQNVVFADMSFSRAKIQMVHTFTLGIAWGIIAETSSVTASLGAHILNNAGALLLPILI